MANNNRQPKVGILLSHSIEGDKLKVIAEVIRNNQGVSGVSVVFYRDGSVIAGAAGSTLADGKIIRVFNLPAPGTTTRIKVEAGVDGVTSKEVTVSIPANVPGQSRQELPVLVIEDNRISDSVHTLTLGLFNSKGKMIDGMAQLRSNRPILVTTPRPTALRRNGAHRISATVRQRNNRNNSFELPLKSNRWTSIDIEHSTAFELDVFVAEWNRKIELSFDGPRPASHGQVPLTRPLFAGLFVWVFFTGLLSSIFGFTVLMPWPAILALLPTALFVFLVLTGSRIYNLRLRNARNEVPPSPGVFASFVSTNNRWLFSMVAMDALMFIIVIWSIFTMWGSPILMHEYRDNIPEVRRIHERRPGDDAQRFRNIQRNLGPATDRELAKDESEVPWQPLVVRVIAFLLMLLVTIIYIPIAASDEVGGFAHRIIGHFGHSHTEGTADGGFISRMIARFRPAIQVSSEGVRVEPQGPAAPPQGQAPPPPQNPQSPANWLRSLIPAVVADFLIGGIIDAAITLFRRNRRESHRRRAEA